MFFLEKCDCDSSGTVPFAGLWLSCPNRKCNCKTGFTGETCNLKLESKIFF